MNAIYDEIKLALHHVWRRRWLALAIAWGTCLLGWLVIGMIPNKYESKARIFVQVQSLLPDKMGISAADRQREIDRIRTTLTSTISLEKVVRGTALARTVSTDKEVTAKATSLAKNVEVVAEQDNLFQIAATSSEGNLSDAENAKLSKAIVQKLIDLFVNENLSSDRGDIDQTMRFLDAQLAVREKALQEAEAKRAAFEQKYLGQLPGIGSPSQRMEALRSELNQVDSSLIAAQSGMAALGGQLASTNSSVSTPGAAVGGDGRMAGLQGQIADAQARGLTENHPDMIILRDQLARARAAGGGARVSAGTSAPNPAFASLRASLAERQATVAALSARKAQLAAEMGQFQSKQAAEPAIAAEQAQINRDYDILKGQYDKMLQDREDIRLRGAVQTQTDPVRFKVIDPPSSPGGPAAPNRPLLLFGMLLGGLGVGAAAAYALAQIYPTYTTPAKLEKVSGLPVIGSITEVLPSTERRLRRKKLVWFLGGAGGLVAVWLLLLIIDMVQRSGVA
jgi:polysaccharide biosynthesis transport protein